MKCGCLPRLAQNALTSQPIRAIRVVTRSVVSPMMASLVQNFPDGCIMEGEGFVVFILLILGSILSAWFGD
jgi:hypothetical protein